MISRILKWEVCELCIISWFLNFHSRAKIARNIIYLFIKLFIRQGMQWIFLCSLSFQTTFVMATFVDFWHICHSRLFVHWSRCIFKQLIVGKPPKKRSCYFAGMLVLVPETKEAHESAYPRLTERDAEFLTFVLLCAFHDSAKWAEISEKASFRFNLQSIVA